MDTKDRVIETGGSRKEETRREFVQKNLARLLFISGAVVLANRQARAELTGEHGDRPAHSDTVHGDAAHSDWGFCGLHGDAPHSDHSNHINVGWHDWYDAVTARKQRDGAPAYHVDTL